LLSKKLGHKVFTHLLLKPIGDEIIIFAESRRKKCLKRLKMSGSAMNKVSLVKVFGRTHASPWRGVSKNPFPQITIVLMHLKVRFD
jgi:hypothetical protein